eukprot:6190541-Pleurochrysis_carterae.AAC.6
MQPFAVAQSSLRCRARGCSPCACAARLLWAERLVDRESAQLQRRAAALDHSARSRVRFRRVSARAVEQRLDRAQLAAERKFHLQSIENPRKRTGGE